MTDQRTPDDRLRFREDAPLRELALSLQADAAECEPGCIDHEVCLAPSEVLGLLDRLRVAPLDVDRLARALMAWWPGEGGALREDAEQIAAEYAALSEPVSREPREPR